MTTRKVNGAAVRVIRELSGIRHSDLARRAEVSRPTLTLVEQGARQVSPAVLRRLADGLNVPIEAISYPGVTSAALAVAV